MSQQHFCADGTHQWTGRASTPAQRASVCINNGGELDRDGNPINRPPVIIHDDPMPILPPTPIVHPPTLPGNTPGVQPPVVITTSTTAPTTAGLGDNKMLIWLVVAGVALWYMNKEGYLKKILK